MIRVAGPGDVEVVHRLVTELAAYEKEPAAVAMTPADLDTALFGPVPAAHCLVATTDHLAGDPTPPQVAAPPQVVGFALWHPTFSTWTGQTGMYLVDLFVRPNHRRRGYGQALLTTLATICADRGYRRMEWAVLDWNAPAQAFYRSLGAGPIEGWTTWRMDADAITTLAGVGTGSAAADDRLSRRPPKPTTA